MGNYSQFNLLINSLHSMYIGRECLVTDIFCSTGQFRCSQWIMDCCWTVQPWCSPWRIYPQGNCSCCCVVIFQGLCTILWLRILYKDVYFLFHEPIPNPLFLLPNSPIIVVFPLQTHSNSVGLRCFLALNLNGKIHVCAYNLVLIMISTLFPLFDLHLNFSRFLNIVDSININSCRNIQRLGKGFLQPLLLPLIS